MVLVSHFIDKIEAVRRELPLAPPAYQSFVLTVCATTNELLVLLSKVSLSNLYRSHSLSAVQGLASTEVTSLSLVRFASLLHHYCCNSSHLKNKTCLDPTSLSTHIPIALSPLWQNHIHKLSLSTDHKPPQQLPRL